MFKTIVIVTLMSLGLMFGYRLGFKRAKAKYDTEVQRLV